MHKDVYTYLYIIAYDGTFRKCMQEPWGIVPNIQAKTYLALSIGLSHANAHKASRQGLEGPDLVAILWGTGAEQTFSIYFCGSNGKPGLFQPKHQNPKIRYQKATKRKMQAPVPAKAALARDWTCLPR